MVTLSSKPDERSLSDFKNLNSAERRLREKCRIGKCAVITESEKGDVDYTIRASFVRFLALGGDVNAPVHENGVMLQGALVSGDLNFMNSNLPHSLNLNNCQLNNVNISNSNIHGFLNFSGCYIRDLDGAYMVCSGSVLLEKAFIAIGPVDLEGAQIGGNLNCKRGTFNAKDGYALKCIGTMIKGNIFLGDDFTATGTVDLTAVKIGGSLACNGGKFDDGKKEYALLCDRAVIEGDILLGREFSSKGTPKGNGFNATGTVRLTAVQIGSCLACDGGNFNGNNNQALICDGVVIKGSVLLRREFTSTGTVSMSNAHIGGNIECDGGKFNGNNNQALICDGAVIKGSVFLRHGFVALDTVRLIGAHIGGNLECKNGYFDGKKGDALLCENAVVKGSVFFTESFIAMGTARLTSMQISCNLECTGKFYGKNGNEALFCDGAVINGQVCLNNGFTANGVVKLLGVQIGRDLNCSNAKFIANTQNDVAFACDKAIIKGSVHLLGDFVAIGAIRFLGAQIGGDMECNYRATFIGGTNGKALIMDGMTVAGTFFFCDLNIVKGKVSLVCAKIGTLKDEANSYSEVELALDGFVYDKLVSSTPPDAKSRLAWLDKQYPSHTGLAGDNKDFRPQPWQQLQKVLREMGHIEDAKQVGIAFEDRLREANLIGQSPENWCPMRAWLYRKTCRAFHRLFGWLIGYGYRSFGLLFKMFIVWLVWGLFYWSAAVLGNNGNGVFAPNNPLVFQNPDYAVCVPNSKEAMKEKTKVNNEGSPPIQGAGNWYLCKNLRKEYTGFSPFAYSLDLLLPFVDLQQENDWAPMIPTPEKTSAFWTWSFNCEYFIRFMMWFEILFGWVASLLLVAMVSGLTKRRDE